MFHFGKKDDLEEGDPVTFIDHAGRVAVGKYIGPMPGGYLVVNTVNMDGETAWKVGIRPACIIPPQRDPKNEPGEVPEPGRYGHHEHTLRHAGSSE